ncbi:hypothetical protein ACHAXT_008456 [Thalassiosira profunda]
MGFFGFPSSASLPSPWLATWVAPPRLHRSPGASPFCRRPRRQGSSSVSLGAWLDHPIHRDIAPASTARPSVVAPSSSVGLELAGGSVVGRDIAGWLASTSSDASTLDAIEESSAGLSSTTFALASTPERPPSKEEVALLQQAFAAFYGAERDVPEAYKLLSECIKLWEATGQGGDEIAGLYRVRGDVNMELYQPNAAEADYGRAITYLEGPDGNKADPEELPASRLGRARAVRSMGASASPSQASQASKDYAIYFSSISRLDDDEGADAKKSGEFSEAITDGMQRNPYAAWEWGMVERVAGNCERAAEVHRLASAAFDEIGDKPRSVICALDRGIDLASGLDGGKEGGKRLANAKTILEEAISSDVNVEGRDVELLQRVVAKEGEARIALSGILWDANQKSAAEQQYGTACARLDELTEDYRAREAERIKKGRMPPAKPKGASLGFSIDDVVGAEQASCSRFKSEKYVDEKVVWSVALRSKVKTFLALGR